MHARVPNAYLYRPNSLLCWVMGPHIDFKSSLVIKRPHNSGGVECEHAIKAKGKPGWKTILTIAVLCTTKNIKEKQGNVVMGDRPQPSHLLSPVEGFRF